MKKTFIIMALCAPVWVWGQLSAGLLLAGYDCNLDGAGTGTKSRQAFGAGAWAEWRAKEWLGIRASAGYVPRGGVVLESPVSADYVSAALGLRLHVADGGDGGPGFVFGAGLVADVAAVGDKPDFLSGSWVSPMVEVGIEWRWVSVMAYCHLWGSDVVKGLEKGQRWAALGLGVEVPLVGRQQKGGLE